VSWHKHHGGPNPYAGIDAQGEPLPQPIVRVGFRCRKVSKDALTADKWRWKHGHPFPPDYAYDIVAYREEAAA